MFWHDLTVPASSVSSTRACFILIGWWTQILLSYWLKFHPFLKKGIHPQPLIWAQLEFVMRTRTCHKLISSLNINGKTCHSVSFNIRLKTAGSKLKCVECMPVITLWVGTSEKFQIIYFWGYLFDTCQQKYLGHGQFSAWYVSTSPL